MYESGETGESTLYNAYAYMVHTLLLLTQESLTVPIKCRISEVEMHQEFVILFKRKPQYLAPE